MLVTEGEGSRFVGDNIENFSAGDLVIVGRNIPHCWKSGTSHYMPESTLRAKAVVALFQTDCFGEDFFNKPEFEAISNLLKRAERGISFSGETKALVSEKLKLSYNLTGIKRFTLFIDLLNDLATSEEYKILSSNNYQSNMFDKDMQRLNHVLDYLLKNFKTEVNLGEIAAQAFMSPTAFCRYFKARTNKTVISFLNELRINHAKNLLVVDSKNIDVIGYESGFRNTAHFYEQFKKKVGHSPNQYRKRFEKLNSSFN